MPVTRLALAAFYGTAVGVVGAAAMRHPDHPDGRLIVLAVLAGFPMVIGMIPFFYLFGAAAWNAAGGEVTDGMAAGPIPFTYGALLGLAAALNAVLWITVGGAVSTRVRSVRAERGLRGRRGG